MYNGLRLDAQQLPIPSCNRCEQPSSHRCFDSPRACTALAGCGQGKGVERLPVHGTVTLSSGEKLSGSITFLPAKGQLGPAATTKLAEGSYKFDRSNGPRRAPKP